MSVIVHALHNNIEPQPHAVCFVVISAMTSIVIPSTCCETCSKSAPKGKHVQLFKMRRKVGKGFYSTVPDAPNSE